MYFYQTIVYLHVVSAILSIGPFFVLLPMLKRMKHANEEQMRAYVETFTFSIRLVKHAGHVLVTTGFLAMWLGHYPLGTSWIVLTLAIMVSSIVFLARAFKPILRTFQTASFQQQRFVARLKKSVWIYLLLLCIMLWCMVTKPMLW